VTTAERDTQAAIRAASLAAAAMIAFLVAGRATREALFLATYGVRSLPRMDAAAAIAAIVAVVAISRPMARFGPGRLVPALLVASALLLLPESALVASIPSAGAVVFYFHVTALGAVLVSGLWSVVNERLDPRTAKRNVGRIAASGSVGGVVGGVVGWWVSALPAATAMRPILVMLAVLAALHLLCAVLLLSMRVERATARPSPAIRETWTTGVRAIAAAPYLRTLVAVVLLATLAEGLFAYVFKAQARIAHADIHDLLRLFAFFNMTVSVLSLAAQTAFSRRALERLGLARTVGLLPWTTAIGGAAALAVPGLGSAMFARGAQLVTRDSLYRSGYELLFTPLAPPVRRAAKPLVDVGVLRLGDVMAAGLIQTVLLTLPGASLTALLMLGITFAAAGIAITFSVHTGYVATLEKSLLSQAVRLDLKEVGDSTTRTTLMRTMTALPRAEVPEAPGAATDEAGPRTLAPPDPVLGRIERLRSRDPARVRAALAARPLEATDVPHALALLAWDEVGADAQRSLQSVAVRHVGQLVDALLDPDEDFTVRRRLPAILARAPSRRAVEGLLAGLADRRFEVRFRCGRALARLAADPALKIEAERVYEAVLREAAVDRRVWESQQLLDRVEDDADAGFVDDVLRERASRSLEHVFTVLSLVLPRQPLQIAFRGLHTDDQRLRGTALEYLETSLPPAVREKLWPFLDDSPRRPGASARPRDAIVAELLRSNESIALNLAARRQGPPT